MLASDSRSVYRMQTYWASLCRSDESTGQAVEAALSFLALSILPITESSMAAVATWLDLCLLRVESCRPMGNT